MVSSTSLNHLISFYKKSPSSLWAEQYRETAKKWYDSEKGTDFEKHFSFVYYKTGYLSQDEIKFAKRNEYKVITKDTLLKIIEDYSGNNIIISDYKELLQSKFSEQELVYKTSVEQILKNKDWVKPFHESLKDDLDTPRRWKKIFMGWYWCSDSIGEFNLQLNGFDLLIQFSPKSDKDENIEKAVAKINAAMKKFPGYKKSFIQKTSGNTIFKIHQEKWLVINKSGCIDRVKTLENLHKYEDFLWLKALGHKK